MEIDRQIARQAAETPGKTTCVATDASLQRIANARRRSELVVLLGEEGRFDFEVAAHAWGGDG